MKKCRWPAAARALLFLTAFTSVVSSAAMARAQSVVSFTLINADTDQPIPVSLGNGAVLNLASLPTRNLNIRANTSPSLVGSVKFSLNGATRTESVAPYACFGDSNGDYRAGQLGVGSYTLQATAYTGSDASGSQGSTFTIKFSVVDETADPVTSPTSPTPPPSSGTAITQGPATLFGEFKYFHKLTMLVEGPYAGESDSYNPFTNYRLDVQFVSPSGRRLTVPGHFAADGNAAETGNSGGSRWRVYLTPEEQGTWAYQVSFRKGPNVNMAAEMTAGTAIPPDGHTGTFSISGTDKTGADFRGKGILRYANEHRLRFSGTGEYFVKAGPGSPENLLAYQDFDGTYDAKGSFLHRYEPHLRDWRTGDPTWQGGKGKGLIGAMNYLASKSMNSMYFLTMNVNGDGQDVWPWTSHTERLRYDVSKLDQWEIVFTHMDRLGIALHVITQEQENDQLLDGGALGPQRRLYYRELISRFAHHPAVTWNLGEENTNTDSERKQFAQFIRATDPYRHPIKVHTKPGEIDLVYTPLLGFNGVEGASLQTSPRSIFRTTVKWIQQSKASGRPWVVAYDEQTPSSVGVAPDLVDPANHELIRKYALWGHLMAGGSGVEYYFGDANPEDDLTCEDFRSRDSIWNVSRYALQFFRSYLPLRPGSTSSELSDDGYVLAWPGDVYAVYLFNGGSASLDLGNTTGSFTVHWYDPRQGGSLQTGTVRSVTGPYVQSIGSAPFSGDAVALVRRSTSTSTSPATESSGATTSTLVTGLTLINADTDQPISTFDPIASGATIRRSSLSTINLNLHTNTSPAAVGSVKFDINGVVRVESTAPYAFFGDSSGDYNAGRFPAGTYTATVTAFSGANATGTASSPLTIKFSIVQ